MYSMYTCTAHMQLRSHYHTCQNLTFYVPRTTKFRLALKDRSYGSVGDSLLSSNRHRRVLPYKWSAVTRAAPIRRPPTDQRSLCRLQRELHCRQENIYCTPATSWLIRCSAAPPGRLPSSTTPPGTGLHFPKGMSAPHYYSTSQSASRLQYHWLRGTAHWHRRSGVSAT